MQQPELSEFRAGFGVVDYTPSSPDGAFTVHDPISFRALILCQGRSAVILVAGDFFSLEQDLMETARHMLGDQPAWIRDAPILPCASHIGTAPILYRSYVKQRQEQLRWFGQEERIADYVAQAIRAAAATVAPAQVAMGQAACPGVLYNRRSYNQEGSLVMSNFLFPYPRPELTYGEVDDTVYALRIDDSQGTPRWCAFSFGCHALCSTDRYGHISADYPGAARRVLSAAGIESLFAPGAIGNVVPVSRGGRTYQRVGHSVGAAALFACENAAGLQPTLQIRSTTIQVATCRDRTVTADETQDGLYRHQAYGRRVHAQRHSLDYTLTEVNLGDASILHLPGEIFVETAKAIRAANPDRRVVVVSGASADIGYLATAKAHQEGGMEPQYAGLAPEAEEQIRRAACELIAAPAADRLAS